MKVVKADKGKARRLARHPDRVHALDKRRGRECGRLDVEMVKKETGEGLTRGGKSLRSEAAEPVLQLLLLHNGLLCAQIADVNTDCHTEMEGRQKG